MIKKTNEDLAQEGFKAITQSKIGKVAIYIIGSIAVIYLAGIVFKVVAKTTNSYIELRNALRS